MNSREPKNTRILHIHKQFYSQIKACKKTSIQAIKQDPNRSLVA